MSRAAVPVHVLAEAHSGKLALLQTWETFSPDFQDQEYPYLQALRKRISILYQRIMYKATSRQGRTPDPQDQSERVQEPPLEQE